MIRQWSMSFQTFRKSVFLSSKKKYTPQQFINKIASINKKLGQTYEITVTNENLSHT